MSTTSTGPGVATDPGVGDAVEGSPFRSLVSELAAVTVDSTDLDAWQRFGSDFLGMSAERDGDQLRLKMDDYPYRFLIRRADRDGIAGLTWVSRGAAALAEIRERWERGGGKSESIETRDWNSGEAHESYAFRDHHGVLHEVFDVAPGGQSAYEPGDDVSGFVTGDAGLGHIVMFDDVDQANRVYVDAFAMTLREDSNKTQVGGRGRFYGCNTRHHTMAAIEIPGKAPGVMHLMVEMLTIDDVGLALDRAKAGGWQPRTSLGRHPDHVISFYIPSPGGFDFEVGYCGLLVESDDHWEANKLDMRAPSWGHDGIRPTAESNE